MTKKVSISDKAFTHQIQESIFELAEAADKNILILSTKKGKEHFTTSLSLADLHMLLEFLKNRGLK